MKPKKMFAVVFSVILSVVFLIGIVGMIVNKGSFSETSLIRQGLISLKTAFLDVLGVNEYNGVYNANDSLIKVCDPVNDINTLENIEIIKNISKSTDKPIYFSLVPTAEYIKRATLKRRPIVWEQGSYIESIYYRLVENVAVVDVGETLYSYANEEIYFKTTNRLSPLGGYHVFQTMMKRLDYQVMEIQKYDVEYHDSVYYGELSNQFKNKNISDQLEFYRYPFYQRNITMKVTDKNGNNYTYKDVFLNDKNGLSAYLGGENPLTVIYNSETFSERLLVVSDWTFNITAGFFVDYFQEITFVNPFLCEDGMEKIDIDKYDYIIVMFSADNFNNYSLSNITDILE